MTFGKGAVSFPPRVSSSSAIRHSLTTYSFRPRVKAGVLPYSLILIDSPAGELLERKIKTLVSLITPTPRIRDATCK